MPNRARKNVADALVYPSLLGSWGLTFHRDQSAAFMEQVVIAAQVRVEPNHDLVFGSILGDDGTAYALEHGKFIDGVLSFTVLKGGVPFSFTNGLFEGTAELKGTVTDGAGSEDGTWVALAQGGGLSENGRGRRAATRRTSGK